MILSSFPVTIISRRNTGLGGEQYNFQFLDQSAESTLQRLLTLLPVNGAVSVPSPSSGDCYLEVRRAASGFEINEGRHGCAGTWRGAAEQEALVWLLRGASCSETKRSGWQLDLPPAQS